MTRTTTGLTLAALGLALAACDPAPNSSAIGARNDCGIDLTVQTSFSQAGVTSAPPFAVTAGETGFVGDKDIEGSGQFYAWAGPMLSDPEARLDESTPSFTVDFDELEEASDGGDHDLFFVIDGERCP